MEVGAEGLRQTTHRTEVNRHNVFNLCHVLKVAIFKNLPPRIHTPNKMHTTREGDLLSTEQGIICSEHHEHFTVTGFGKNN